MNNKMSILFYNLKYFLFLKFKLFSDYIILYFLCIIKKSTNAIFLLYYKTKCKNKPYFNKQGTITNLSK